MAAIMCGRGGEQVYCPVNRREQSALNSERVTDYVKGQRQQQRSRYAKI